MFRKMIFFVSLLLLSGCVSTGAKKSYKPVKKIYETIQFNPVLGEVPSDHPEYLKASGECESKIYAEGIQIGGETVKDRSKLNKISTEHMSEYIKNRLYKDLDINGAYHGASAAVSVATGNYTPSYSSKSKPKSYGDYMKEYMSLEKPQDIKAIDALQESYIKCMREDKQFRPFKTIVKNAKTGEVIMVHELKK